MAVQRGGGRNCGGVPRAGDSDYGWECSFYNETLGKPIYPTPILGVLGVLEDADFAVGSAFDKEGDAIVLLDGADATGARDRRGRAQEFSSSEYARRLRESSRACHRRLIWRPRSD